MTDMDVTGQTLISLDQSDDGDAARPASASRAPVAGAAPVITVEVCAAWHELARHEAAWRVLCDNAAAANPAADPDLLLALFRHLPREQADGMMVLVWRDGAGVTDIGERKLIGLFGLQRQGWRWGVPARLIKSWTHLFCFDGTPLVHRDHLHEAFDGLFGWARSEGGFGTVLLNLMQSDGALYRGFERYLAARGLPSRLFDAHQRAALRPTASVDDYLNAALPRRRRKEYRRLRARLGETGNLESVVTDNPQVARRWLAEFLELEASGWKGRQGTAIACSDELADFMKEYAGRLFDGGCGVFWKITLDGKPVASMLGTKKDNRVWLLKIAYDEKLARYSPGVLLIIDVIAWACARGDIDLIDSCAMPDHPMIDHIWRDRLGMTDILISTRPGAPGGVFALKCLAEDARRRGRAALKALYHRIRKGGRS